METKKMTIANINMVFGKQEEPMIYHIDDVVLPALNAPIKRKSGRDTRLFFSDVKLRMIKGEYVLAGLLIKDTILEVRSEYDELEGLKNTNKLMSSAPFSLFMIFLKNHRMMLVKNQKGSPDIRSFNSTIYKVINKYVANENQKRKSEEKELLLRPQNITVTGIKTKESIKEVLKEVEKVESVTLRFYPLNGEWDLDPLYGIIDDTRRKLNSKTGRMVFNSPGNTDAVVKIIEESDGMAETQMKVRYATDSSLSGTKKRATIKDYQISENMNIDVYGELECAYDQVYDAKKDIRSLNVESGNNIVYYEEFLKRRANNDRGAKSKS